MASKDDKKKILITSLVLTLVIFILAILLNYGLDFFRMNSVMMVMQEHEINTESYLVEQNFINMFGGDKCKLKGARISDLEAETGEVGQELGSYGTLSFFNKKDFDYLKRKYFLLQLKVYTLIKQANDECNTSFHTLLFFYRIDDDQSERQGYILTEISEGYPDKVFVLSFDIDYEDEPLLKLLVQRYNLTEVPSTVVDDSAVLEGLSYRWQIENLFSSTNE